MKIMKNVDMSSILLQSGGKTDEMVIPNWKSSWKHSMGKEKKVPHILGRLNTVTDSGFSQ